MDYTGFREKLSTIAASDVDELRHLNLLTWLTELSQKFGIDSPVLVGCGAVEVYTSAKTSSGDVDIIISDIPGIASHLLKIGFQRSSDQRYYYFPANSILLEFPSDSLRSGERTVTLNHNGVDVKLISPEDLIVDRLESFEASGGGLDLYHAYLIYHLHFDKLDREKLRETVKSRDVRESFIFIRKLHLEAEEKGFSVTEQGTKIEGEYRRRRGF